MVMRWAACAAFLFSAPAFAQSSGAMLVLDRGSLSSVREYVAADAVPSQLALPPNLIVLPMYRPLIESMLRTSPTFRRQCLRLSTLEKSVPAGRGRNPVSGRNEC